MEKRNIEHQTMNKKEMSFLSKRFKELKTNTNLIRTALVEQRAELDSLKHDQSKANGM